MVLELAESARLGHAGLVSRSPCVPVGEGGPIEGMLVLCASSWPSSLLGLGLGWVGRVGWVGDGDSRPLPPSPLTCLAWPGHGGLARWVGDGASGTPS